MNAYEAAGILNKHGYLRHTDWENKGLVEGNHIASGAGRLSPEQAVEIATRLENEPPSDAPPPTYAELESAVKALLECGFDFGEDCSGNRDCIHCNADLMHREPHEEDCPYFVARALVKRIPVAIAAFETTTLTVGAA